MRDERGHCGRPRASHDDFPAIVDYLLAQPPILHDISLENTRQQLNKPPAVTVLRARLDLSAVIEATEI